MLRRWLLSVTLVLMLGAALPTWAGPPAQSAPTPTVPGVLPAPGAPIVPTAAASPVPTITPFSGGGTPVPMDSSGPDRGILPTATPTLTPTPLPAPRFTLLLMGGDRRPGEPESFFRTDVMMLISLDRVNQRVGVLSIPRDLYVTIPGYRNDRINTAYAAGQYSGRGGVLAAQTVSYNFGVPVDAYAVFDFAAFVALIDVIDGIDVLVEQPIADPTYPDMSYGYDPFYLDAGWHHLDGATALKYVRSRHNSDDRERMHRQQQVIAAVRAKIDELGLATALIEFAPALWTQLQTNVDTDLSLPDLLRLAAEFSAIPADNITYGVLSYPYVYATMIDEQSVLVPDYMAIRGLVAQVFGTAHGW